MCICFSRAARPARSPRTRLDSETGEEAFCCLTSVCAPESCWGPIPREKRGFGEWNTEVISFAALRIRSFVTTQAELASLKPNWIKTSFTHTTPHTFSDFTSPPPRPSQSISHNKHATKTTSPIHYHASDAGSGIQKEAADLWPACCL